MSRVSQLACACAAQFSLHAGCGQAAAHAAQTQALIDGRKVYSLLCSGVFREGRWGNWQAMPGWHALGAGMAAKMLRVARLPQLAVPGYHALDAGGAWQARPDLGLALTGRHPLHVRHPEFGETGLRQLAERHVFASATLRF